MLDIQLRPAPIRQWDYVTISNWPKPKYNHQNYFLHFDRTVSMESRLIDILAVNGLEKCRSELEVLLYNLYRAEQAGSSHGVTDVKIAISRDKNWYKRPLSYLQVQHLSYVRMGRVLDHLEQDGYIDVNTGYWNSSYSHGLRTLIRPTTRLNSVLHSFPFRLRTPRRDGLVMLRDHNKSPLKVPTNSQTNAMKQGLRLINQVNERHRYSIGRCYEIPLVSGTLCLVLNFSRLGVFELRYDRIFNRSLKEGGRFYCNAQNMQRATRKSLYIDGCPTIEVDYKALHPRIAYHSCGVDLTNDPYDVGIPGTREIAKLAFLILLNADSKPSAIGALNNALIREKVQKPQNFDLSAFLTNMEQAHSTIAKFFYQGVGRKFQWIDSQIAEGVMLQFAHQQKPCFSIHDSFVVKEEDEALLRKAMVDEYQKVMKTTFVPELKKV